MPMKVVLDNKVLNSYVSEDSSTLYLNRYNGNIMINSEDDLAKLPTGLKPGCLLYTAGYKEMWQVDSEGTPVKL